jgi:hypothetical protein
MSLMQNQGRGSHVKTLPGGSYLDDLAIFRDQLWGSLGMEKKKTTNKTRSGNVFKRYGKAVKDWFLGDEILVKPTRNKHRYDDDDDCVAEASDSNDPVAAVSPYNVYGREPDWTDRFTEVFHPVPVGTKLVAVCDLDMRAMYFHVATWTQLTDTAIPWTLSTYRYENPDEVIFRGTLMVAEEHYAEVKAWWDAYEKRVGKLDVPACLPRIADHTHISGSVVKMCEPMGVRRNINLPNDMTFRQWCWIMSNCNSGIKATGDCWIFEDSSEAVMYTLADPK